MKAGADVTDVREEKFGPTNGRMPGMLGIAAVGVAVVAALADGWHHSDLLLLSCLSLASLLIWVVMFRPAVRSDGAVLHMRNMVSTTSIPLALIDKVLVGAMHARPRRRDDVQVDRGAAFPSPRQQPGRPWSRLGPGGSHQHTVMPMGSIAKEFGNYSDFIEERIVYLADEARVHHRGDDQPVRRTWAWPEIVGIVVLVRHHPRRAHPRSDLAP